MLRAFCREPSFEAGEFSGIRLHCLLLWLLGRDSSVTRCNLRRSMDTSAAFAGNGDIDGSGISHYVMLTRLPFPAFPRGSHAPAPPLPLPRDRCPGILRLTLALGSLSPARLQDLAYLS